jgi:hypothetical protein
MGEIGVYMREDYSVRCDDNPSYSGFLAVAAVCVVLYPIGIPVFFYRLIRDRNEDWARVGSEPLCSNFLPEWTYFEVFELFRKLLLTSVVAFVKPGTATQVMYLFVVNVVALLVLVACRPYASDPDDFLSGMLITTECALFFIVFLLVSEVYTVENYSREGMLNTCFTLIFLALVFFVPMNVVAKVPSVHRQLESWSAMMTAQLSRLGIKVSRMWQLDARSRYQHEIEELRESVSELRVSLAHAQGLDGGRDGDLVAMKIDEAQSVHSPGDGGFDDNDDEDIELRSSASSIRRRRSDSDDDDINLIENPVHNST